MPSRFEGSLETASTIALSKSFRLGSEVLVLAHKLCETIVASGEAYIKLVECCGGGRLRGPLNDLQTVIEGSIALDLARDL